jgi:hypothetical protein
VFSAHSGLCETGWVHYVWLQDKQPSLLRVTAHCTVVLVQAPLLYSSCLLPATLPCPSAVVLHCTVMPGLWVAKRAQTCCCTPRKTQGLAVYYVARGWRALRTIRCAPPTEQPSVIGRDLHADQCMVWAHMLHDACLRCLAFQHTD